MRDTSAPMRRTAGRFLYLATCGVNITLTTGRLTLCSMHLYNVQQRVEPLCRLSDLYDFSVQAA